MAIDYNEEGSGANVGRNEVGGDCTLFLPGDNSVAVTSVSFTEEANTSEVQFTDSFAQSIAVTGVTYSGSFDISGNANDVRDTGWDDGSGDNGTSLPNHIGTMTIQDGQGRPVLLGRGGQRLGVGHPRRRHEHIRAIIGPVFDHIGIRPIAEFFKLAVLAGADKVALAMLGKYPTGEVVHLLGHAPKLVGRERVVALVADVSGTSDRHTDGERVIRLPNSNPVGFRAVNRTVRKARGCHITETSMPPYPEM